MPTSLHERCENGLARALKALRQMFTLCDSEDRPLESPGTPDPEKKALGYWVGELEADTTLESDYIIFLYFLNPAANEGKIRKLANFIQKKQLADGGWNIYHGGPGEVSASVKAYFALKLAGVPTEHPDMLRAREAIIAMGGAERVNTFTKIYLSFLQQLSWEECPAIPPEIVLLPRFFYFNIYQVSYWSRAILVPLSILYARRPRREVPDGLNIKEIYANSDGNKRTGNGTETAMVGGQSGKKGTPGTPKLNIPRDPNIFSWKNFFLLVDRILKLVEKTPVKPFRGLALRRAENWMISHLEKSDGLGAIFPAMVNSAMAMRALGYKESHPKLRATLEKLERLEIAEGDTIRLQPCESPVWDTALAMNAVHEAGSGDDDPQLIAAARWLVTKEVRTSGDWQYRSPNVEVSGWYFQFQNEFYPDVDDAAAVLMALERTDLTTVPGGDDAIRRGINWILSMQCSNGGWASFDIDVDAKVFTQVPFADHNAMLDPACVDITGRVLETLSRFEGLRDHPRVQKAVRRAVEYIEKAQDPSGSWYGRWGVNYIYGTYLALKGLVAIGESPAAPYIRKAVDWLKSCQNDDGGWGESCGSYDDPTLKGVGSSTASQTAWAITGLMVCGETDSPEVRQGLEYLLSRQKPDGTWDEDECTGTGFPSVFYLNYHLYRLYFPIYALGLYHRERTGQSSAQMRKQVKIPQKPPRRTSGRISSGARRALHGIFRG